MFVKEHSTETLETSARRPQDEQFFNLFCLGVKDDYLLSGNTINHRYMKTQCLGKIF
jgi:hypothetical protein